MYESDNLTGSQIIICEHTEWKSSNIIPWILGRIVLTTSGYVIEFTGKLPLTFTLTLFYFVPLLTYPDFLIV